MNRLQHETSPYLRQHQDNPVDWYPWGEEAFVQAISEDKPILLSIGYAACHWCHVMAHESFEDEETAAMMNELFVNIKVDREERPDVDDIYMQATLAFTRGHGGWPMTVFLTPDGKPFHAGTYFPPTPRYGMPSFKQIMVAAHDAYINKREDLEKSAAQITTMLQQQMGAFEGAAAEFDTDLITTIARKLISRADRLHGGLHSGQPKFPSPMNLDFLLRYYADSKDEQILETVLFTLKKMANGGIYDQIGGGFHRYSVDERWLVPHFEKMLYDNAQLARVYLHVYQITGNRYFSDICRDILTYVEREMLDSSGGFYSTQDADSEGVEGKFYVWSRAEMESVLSEKLSAEQIELYLELFDISEDGNFEGENIPNLPQDMLTFAQKRDIDVESLQNIVETARELLFEYREKRIKPGLDDKMLSAWNGMMLAAFAEAARVQGDSRYLEIAQQNAEFILRKLSMEDGRLYRTHKRNEDGGESKIKGFLEDYANVIDGLLELYQSDFDVRWFKEAQRLADYVMAHFRGEDGAFFDTSDSHEKLIARPRSMQDNATPAGNTLMAYNLIKLAAYTGNAEYEQAAVDVLNQISMAVREYPSAFGMALSAINLLVNRVIEVAIIGDKNDSTDLLKTAQFPFRPRVITALSTEDTGDSATPELLAHRTQREDLPTVYVCQNFACAAPVNTVEALEPLLGK